MEYERFLCEISTGKLGNTASVVVTMSANTSVFTTSVSAISMSSDLETSQAVIIDFPFWKEIIVVGNKFAIIFNTFFQREDRTKKIKIRFRKYTKKPQARRININGGFWEGDLLAFTWNDSIHKSICNN